MLKSAQGPKGREEDLNEGTVYKRVARVKGPHRTVKRPGTKHPGTWTRPEGQGEEMLRLEAARARVLGEGPPHRSQSRRCT